jgi:hypothetical protein
MHADEHETMERAELRDASRYGGVMPPRIDVYSDKDIDLKIYERRLRPSAPRKHRFGLRAPERAELDAYSDSLLSHVRENGEIQVVFDRVLPHFDVDIPSQRELILVPAIRETTTQFLFKIAIKAHNTFLQTMQDSYDPGCVLSDIHASFASFDETVSGVELEALIAEAERHLPIACPIDPIKFLPA